MFVLCRTLTRIPAVCGGGQSLHLLENLGEMSVIGEADGISNIGYGKICFPQHPASVENSLLADVLGNAAVQVFGGQTVEPGAANVEFFTDIVHRDIFAQILLNEVVHMADKFGTFRCNPLVGQSAG